MMLSKGNQSLLLAFQKGYRVIKGRVFYKNKEVGGGIHNGYKSFWVRPNKCKPARVMLHRLVAYQKYGDVIFNQNLLVRHVDSNCLNNTDRNIALGNAWDNEMDKSDEVRKRVQRLGAKAATKHDHPKIIKMHNDGLSYKAIMRKTGITSQGTISFIIKKSNESIETSRLATIQHPGVRSA